MLGSSSTTRTRSSAVPSALTLPILAKKLGETWESAERVADRRSAPALLLGRGGDPGQAQVLLQRLALADQSRVRHRDEPNLAGSDPDQTRAVRTRANDPADDRPTAGVGTAQTEGAPSRGHTAVAVGGRRGGHDQGASALREHRAHHAL